MKNSSFFGSLTALLLLFSCSSSGDGDGQLGICDEHSEWRDHNGEDKCSYYSSKTSCSKILGKLRIMSRMHKGFAEKDVFGGGMSSRWLEIEKNRITYFDPQGNISDEGTCSCENGVLNVKWKKGDNVPEKATIYFRDQDTVELRYYDYPFDIMKFAYDTTRPKTNPTKIFGTIEN
jgi:hypothetical protein